MANEKWLSLRYLATGSRSEVASFLVDKAGKHYVYVLRRPDSLNTPFYVGIGRGSRVFSHEAEAKESAIASAKLDTIRGIFRDGKTLIYSIESIHEREPFLREAELIQLIGTIKAGTGPLTNEQAYEPAAITSDGVILRKYAAHGKRGIPDGFKFGDKRIYPGPQKPSGKPTSVKGRIFAVVCQNPGLDGYQLVELLRQMDWKEHKSAYVQGDEVSAAWVCGYISGAIEKKKNLYLNTSRNHFP